MKSQIFPVTTLGDNYLQVHFLRFWLNTRFASIDLYAEMVHGQHIIIVHVHNSYIVSGYKVLHFGPIRRNIKHYVPQFIKSTHNIMVAVFFGEILIC